MINTTYPPSSRKQEQKRNKPLKARLGQLFDIFLVVVAAVLLLYTGSSAYKLYSGLSLEDPHPKFAVRLQISNASGQAGLEKPLARQWGNYHDQNVSIEIVDQIYLDGHPVPETFLILRGDSPELGKALADAFGLPENAVVIKPIEADTHQVTATLVVGKNWSTALRRAPVKEIPQSS